MADADHTVPPASAVFAVIVVRASAPRPRTEMVTGSAYNASPGDTDITARDGASPSPPVQPTTPPNSSRCSHHLGRRTPTSRVLATTPPFYQRPTRRRRRLGRRRRRHPSTEASTLPRQSGPGQRRSGPAGAGVPVRGELLGLPRAARACASAGRRDRPEQQNGKGGGRPGYRQAAAGRRGHGLHGRWMRALGRVPGRGGPGSRRRSSLYPEGAPVRSWRRWHLRAPGRSPRTGGRDTSSARWAAWGPVSGRTSRRTVPYPPRGRRACRRCRARPRRRW